MAHGAVSATVTAASVLVAFTVNFQSEAAADVALPALGTALSTPAAASAFLTTAELTVMVETVNTPPAKLALAMPPHTPPPLPPLASSSSCSSAADSASAACSSGFVAVVIGTVVSVAAVWLLVYCAWRAHAKHVKMQRTARSNAEAKRLQDEWMTRGQGARTPVRV